jgi:hypothetical protein
MLEGSLFKFATQPVAGDVHLGNVIVVGSDKVYAVDLGDMRQKIPNPLVAGPKIGWEQYAFNRRVRAPQLLAINRGIVLHKVLVMNRLERLAALIKTAWSHESFERAQAFCRAVQAQL